MPRSLGLAYDGAPSLLEGVNVSRHYWPQGAALDAPAARVRVHEGPGWEVWDTNGQSVVYMAGSKVGRFFPASGEDVVLFDTGIELWMKNIAVSPDGNTIYLAEFVSHTRRKLMTNFGDRPRPR